MNFTDFVLRNTWKELILDKNTDEVTIFLGIPTETRKFDESVILRYHDLEIGCQYCLRDTSVNSDLDEIEIESGLIFDFAKPNVHFIGIGLLNLRARLLTNLSF